TAAGTGACARSAAARCSRSAARRARKIATAAPPCRFAERCAWASELPRGRSHSAPPQTAARAGGYPTLPPPLLRHVGTQVPACLIFFARLRRAPARDRQPAFAPSPCPPALQPPC